MTIKLTLEITLYDLIRANKNYESIKYLILDEIRKADIKTNLIVVHYVSFAWELVDCIFIGLENQEKLIA